MSQYRILPDGLAASRQLENEIVGACRKALRPGMERLEGLSSLEEWEAYRSEITETFLSAFPEMMKHRAPMEPRFVSRADFGSFYVENWIFCSLPGWEVNASVYHPAGEGPFPAVVCPTGHASKCFPNYVNSAQVFARNGYIAVSFDPPGMGELARLNEHFVNGVIGWLTGVWSQTHFVADALACLDYLETRSDVDSSRGFAMTGVSGGGLTTIFAAAYDKRVSFAAPVCCVSEQESIHFKNLYTACPEQHGADYIKKGVNQSHILALIAPRPMLMMGGKLDFLFDYRETEDVLRQLKGVYRLYGREDDVDLFIQEDSPHAYTVKMANLAVAWMNRVFRRGEEPLPLEDGDMVRPSEEQLACRPVCPVNMFTVSRDEARRLRAERPRLAGEALRERLVSLLGLDRLSTDGWSAWEKPEEELSNLGGYYFRDVVIRHGGDRKIPGILEYRIGSRRAPGVLYIDEAGKWSGYDNTGPLAGASGTCGGVEESRMRVTMSADVSGFGELEPNHALWDYTSWNNIERILSYLSIAHGVPVLGYQVRDALIALEYFRSRPEVDPDRVILAGRGLGAIVALLCGCLAAEKVEKVVLVEPLAAYQCLTENFPNRWMPTPVLNGVLKYLDLPDVVSELGAKAVVINPCDEMRRPMTEAMTMGYYAEAMTRGAKILRTDRPDDAFVAACTAE